MWLIGTKTPAAAELPKIAGHGLDALVEEDADPVVAAQAEACSPAATAAAIVQSSA